MSDNPEDRPGLPRDWNQRSPRDKAEWLYHEVFSGTPRRSRAAWIDLVAKLLEPPAPPKPPDPAPPGPP